MDGCRGAMWDEAKGVLSNQRGAEHENLGIMLHAIGWPHWAVRIPRFMGLERLSGALRRSIHKYSCECIAVQKVGKSKPLHGLWLSGL